VASPKAGTPSCSFPLVASPLLALARGYQGTRGLKPIMNYQIKNLQTTTNYFIGT